MLFVAVAIGVALGAADDESEWRAKDARKSVPARSLADAWRDGPKTYLGLQVAGFPNLFTITGPGSPSVLSNMISSCEQHVDWISGCLSWLEAQGIETIEADPEAQEAWVAKVNEAAGKTLFPKANSWYIGANIPGKPRVFMPYVGGHYRQICNEVAAEGYRGFLLQPSCKAPSPKNS